VGKSNLTSNFNNGFFEAISYKEMSSEKWKEMKEVKVWKEMKKDVEKEEYYLLY
jgi:hypothetical protein